MASVEDRVSLLEESLENMRHELDGYRFLVDIFFDWFEELEERLMEVEDR